MAEKRDSETKQIGKSLTLFERSLKTGCIEESLAEELVSIIKKAQVHLSSGRLPDADSDLSAALLAIKRHLGTEISLRQGFVLSSILVEEVRRHIADPAILIEDAMDFAVTFFEILSQNKYRSGGLPDYLMKRPFPKGYKTAAAELIGIIRNFELPEEPRNTLIADIKAMEMHAPAFAEGTPSAHDLLVFNELITTLCFDLLDVQGSYLSKHQVLTVLGMVIFALPAWLCLALPAWIAQAVIAAMGLAIYGIYRLMKTPASASAYKNIWHFVEDCTKTAKEALDQLKEETKDLSDDEKRDVKGSLERTLDGVMHSNIPYTGEKFKVVAKLRALIGAL